MLKTPCPSCGGELVFRTKTSVLAVCPYCRSNVIRHDVDLELIGKQGELQEDMSPLQIGASGKYKGKTFYILGRQIISWTDGRWNEWYIAFNDGSDGWIAEAQGEYMISFKGDVRDTPGMNDISSSKTLSIQKKIYERIDKKKVTCLGSEGELPFKAIEGRKSVIYDFASKNYGFASVEANDEDGTNLYVGKYTNLKRLSIIGLRSFEGWGRP